MICAITAIFQSNREITNRNNSNANGSASLLFANKYDKGMATTLNKTPIPDKAVVVCSQRSERCHSLNTSLLIAANNSASIIPEITATFGGCVESASKKLLKP